MRVSLQTMSINKQGHGKEKADRVTEFEQHADEELKAYVTEALKGSGRKRYTKTVANILIAADWDVELLKHPGSKQDLINILMTKTDAFIYNRLIRRGCDSRKLDEVHGCATTIASSLVNYDKYDPKDKPHFISSAEQLTLCFGALESSSLPDFLNSYDEKQYLQKHPFLLAHKLGSHFKSSAADELNSFLGPSGFDTAMVIGVSGCGKSHAIYKNAMNKLCLYFTPVQDILSTFVDHASACRSMFSSEHEEKFRRYILPDFNQRLTARYIVLKYILSLQFDFETLFFLQSTNVLNLWDKLMYNLLSSNYSDVSLNLNDSFVCVDECQLYFLDQLEILFRTGDKESKSLSFCRYFSWYAYCSSVKFVLSGTSLKLKYIDRLGTDGKELSVYSIQLITGFDYLGPADVALISEYALGKFKDVSLLLRMSEILQGRPRILMNFLLQFDTQNNISLNNLDEYCTRLTENGESTVWSLFNLWKNMYEGIEKNFKVNLQIRNEASYPIDIHNCFIRILVDSLLYLDADSEPANDGIHGSWFTLKSAEVETIELGVCPLVDIDSSKYMLMEPLTMISGVYYMMQSISLRNSLFDHVLSAMFQNGATPQSRGSYFELFLALKVSLSAEFRQRIFQMAVEEGTKDVSTHWISEQTLPEQQFFKLIYNASDSMFVQSFKENRPEVLLPSVTAGPDVKWWVFVFALKTTWSKKRVAHTESKKNYETCDPELFFSWRGKRKFEQGSEKQLKRKRKLLNETCRAIVNQHRKDGLGTVRVRIELPSSKFVSPAKSSQTNHHINDIFLCLNWETFSTLLSDQERKLFMAYF